MIAGPRRAAANPARRLDGPAAEARACRHLEARGLRLVTRNFRCRRGEIDLVMEEGETLVFVEVRYRHDTRFGRAEETVGRAKQARLLAAAALYLQREPTRVARFDVVAIHPGGGGFRVEWIRDAFAAV